jgi:hypothetical protein
VYFLVWVFAGSEALAQLNQAPERSETGRTNMTRVNIDIDPSQTVESMTHIAD